MHLVYENDLGRIDMSGGGRMTWRITSISGLELPPKSFNVTNYAGQDGQETLSEVSNARTITIGGDVVNNDQLRYQLSKAVRIFNKPGVLRLYLYNKLRKIECRVNVFETNDRNGAVQPFILQLIADKPAFEDFENTSISVFERVDMLKGENILPMVLTRRTTDAKILNAGDLKTEPIFYIYNIFGGTGGRSENGIEIKNNTSGQFIKLMYSTAPQEEIVINIPKRTITSSINDNIINYISDDTFLSKFWLDTGINHIEVLNYNPNEDINAVCEFTNKYIEAVY